MCLFASLSAQVHSQEPGDLNSSPVADTESQFPFINMLEFLGEFEAESGEWVSPDILGNEAFADLDARIETTGDADARSERRVLSASTDEEE